MCTDCQDSEMGKARIAELGAARQALRDLGINERIADFLFRHQFQGRVPRGEALPYTKEQQAALTRFNKAQSAVRCLHEEFLLARQQARVAARQTGTPVTRIHLECREGEWDE